MAWVGLVLIYGLLKGGRGIVKKKSLEKSSVMEVLFFYTLFSFLLVLPDAKNAVGLTPVQYGYVALKSFIIFLAWILSFKAIKKMPISLYGILDLSRVLFATLLGTIVLKETLGTNQIIGLILVASGLLLLKFKGGRKRGQKKEGAEASAIVVIFALGSCMLNAVSGLMDKILMKQMNSSQLQFFYMLFLVLYYLIYIICSKEKLHIANSLKNYWIWLLAIMFVVADRSLFLANAMAESKVTVMTLIKQSGCLVTILGGKFVFHEKNIGYKLFCAGVIVAGIVVAVL